MLTIIIAIAIVFVFVLIIVRVYQREGKRTIWTFALGTEETKYIFYVPEGTISKEVKLK